MLFFMPHIYGHKALRSFSHFISLLINWKPLYIVNKMVCWSEAEKEAKDCLKFCKTSKQPYAVLWYSLRVLQPYFCHCITNHINRKDTFILYGNMVLWEVYVIMQPVSDFSSLGNLYAFTNCCFHIWCVSDALWTWQELTACKAGWDIPVILPWGISSAGNIQCWRRPKLLLFIYFFINKEGMLMWSFPFTMQTEFSLIPNTPSPCSNVLCYSIKPQQTS